MNNTEPKLDIRVEIITSVSDSSADAFTLDTAIARFYSTPNKKFMSHMIETKQIIPTINCSRDGTKCPTPITELQIHNDHVPKHTSMESLATYVERIITELTILTKKLDVQLITTNENGTFDVVPDEDNNDKV